MDLTSFKALTFDCYGTLIDWERGLLAAIQPVLRRAGVAASDEDILALYAELESEAEAGAYRPYRQVLVGVMHALGTRFGLEFGEAERRALVDSIGRWPAFPDTPDALRSLKRHYKLAVLSNIDRDLFVLTKPHLGVDLDVVVTAELCHSYKPEEKHFRVGQALLELPRERILHVAQSKYHDIAPARALGFATVWVNRRGTRPEAGGTGATPACEVEPDLEVPDLATLARLVQHADWR